jgi:hypothetical protein
MLIRHACGKKYSLLYCSCWEFVKTTAGLRNNRCERYQLSTGYRPPLYLRGPRFESLMSMPVLNEE